MGLRYSPWRSLATQEDISTVPVQGTPGQPMIIQTPVDKKKTTSFSKVQELRAIPMEPADIRKSLGLSEAGEPIDTSNPYVQQMLGQKLTAEALKELVPQKTQLDLTPLMALGASLSGDQNLLRAYKRPEGQEEAMDRAIKSAQYLQKQREDLAQTAASLLTAAKGGTSQVIRQQAAEDIGGMESKVVVPPQPKPIPVGKAQDKLPKGPNLQTYSKSNEPLSEIASNLDSIYKMTGGFDTSKKNIPGLNIKDQFLPTGAFTNKTLGYGEKEGLKALELRSAAQNLTNAIGRAKFAGALTANEAARLDKSLASGFTSGPQERLTSLKRVAKDFYEILKNKEGAFSERPDMLKAYTGLKTENIPHFLNPVTKGKVTDKDIDKMSKEELKKFLEE